ncbi:MAG: mismatch repair protein MutL protein [candidate division TM6 bacterium GW2011_GWE2_42_60]|nr:MAG: mismatch repair protein MutL protein [candidate division TM6 bacterium GW2011_GWE2_42_60]
MGKIHLLPPSEIQKIAAGEVVERPASVVKELIENALDAGATEITLFFEAGGKDLIRIIDNGCGMTEDDAQLCIQNHATSKLTTVEDLSAITTFGFRGEALASIAAVSHFTLKTRSAENHLGITIAVENSEIVSTAPIACNQGTDITARNLFYNVPARQKFLKKDETEWRALHQLIIAVALENLSCTFTVHHNGRQILLCPSCTTLTERMSQLFEPAIVPHLLSCNQTLEQKETSPLTFSALFTRPSRTRYDKNQIYCFVNRRWVKNHKLAQAFIKGFRNILPPQQYPIGALFLTLPHAEVDINVHPRKEEVQFLHPIRIERFIEETIATTLDNTVQSDLGAQRQNNFEYAHTSSFRPATRPAFNPTMPTTAFKNVFQNYNAAPLENQNNQCCTTEECVHEQQDTLVPQTTSSSARLIGQLLNTYLLVENEDGLLLIDQHAAHERILYELFATRFGSLAPIELLFPQLIPLSSEECNALLPHLPFFHEQGIEIELFGENRITVRAVPAPLKNSNLTDIVRTAAHWILEGFTLEETNIVEKLYEKLRAMMACKAAVKAGDVLSQEEMLELIEKLGAIEHRTTCPHGRPTTWRFTQYDIERFFQRCG